jgi:type IV pilus assembly protein PilW
MTATQRTHHSNFHKHKPMGFTLVELLVSMILGLFLMGGVASVFLSNQQNFKTNENLATMQENARFAFEQLSREIRDAGTNPCGVRAVNSVVRATPGTTIPWWGDWNAGTIRGYDGAESIVGSTIAFGASTNNRVTGTDAITILRTTNNDTELRTVASHNALPGFENVTFSSPARLRQQDLMFICDSFSGAIFEATTPTSTGLNASISYDAASPSSNCSTALGWSTATNCITNSITKTFTLGSVITKFDPGIWYIGVNSDSGRSLYRETVDKQTSPDIIITKRLEMIPDVHDMQIQYLVRTNPSTTATGTATAAVLATDWVDASTINAQAGTWSTANLNEAIAVKIALTFRSRESVGTVGANDVKLERKTIAVINLRSRELKP